jgi:hypothetical protein
VNPQSVTLQYREEITCLARSYFPHNLGVNMGGFAGEWINSALIR